MDIGELRALAEKKMAECDSINNAPFGFDPAESQAYLRGKASALQWLLEMLPDDVDG